MKWMEIAWADVGVHEIPGAKANPTIVDYFREVGRGDVSSDEVAWCAAFVGACLARAGVPVALPEGEELLASSYLKVGTPIDKAKPRVGAIALIRTGTGSGYHVAFVSAWNDTHLKLLGGNQADSVNETWFPRSSLAALRWPPVAATPATLAADGSRIVTAANGNKRDGVKGGAAEVAGHLVENGADAAGLVAAKVGAVDLQTIADTAGNTQIGLETLERFALFVIGRGGLIGTAIAVYFLVRMVWRSGWIEHWRTEDHNTGKTASAPATTENAT